MYSKGSDRSLPLPQPPIKASELANIYTPDIPLSVQLPQITHRMALLSAFSPSAFLSSSDDTPPRILEIGCGQGDTTVAILAKFGPEGKGHVTAIDPGSPAYGSPLTLGEAQAKVMLWAAALRVGKVRFEQCDAVEFASERASGDREFDTAVLGKCLWYFPSRGAVRETLAAAAKVARRVCVAEWGLGCVDEGGQAHVEACKAQGLLYQAITTTGLDPQVQAAEVDSFLEKGSNLRTLLSAEDIKTLAEEVGLRLVREEVVESSRQADLQDGMWDVGQVVLGERFLKRVEDVERGEGGNGEERKALCRMAREARERAVEEAIKLGGVEGSREERMKRGLKGVRAMDVWIGEFEV